MPQFLALLSPVRAGMPESPTPAEAEAVAAHFAYLQDALARGVLILAGRSLDESPVGLVIFEAADEDAARAFVARDPAVARAVMRADLRPYRVALYRPPDGNS